MAEDFRVRDEDTDSLYILPLAIIPLTTAALRKARLIKNSRLEGVVEMFYSKETGSGQIAPQELQKVLGPYDGKDNDIEIVKSLSVLPSYDVYSLRVELRKLGIAVDKHSHLRISDKKKNELSQYMIVFTQPLIKFIYESEDVEVESYTSLIQLFSSPNVEIARRNLDKLASRLAIPIDEVPSFLEDYGDVYLSLSYYQLCLDRNMPILAEFAQTIEEIGRDPHFRKDRVVSRRCTELDAKLKSVVSEVQGILDLFKTTTKDMWEDLSASNFGTTKNLIEAYSTKVGGILCAVTVKMNAWVQRFPEPGTGGLYRRVDFIMSDMRQGLELI